ncbi:MAG: cytochrome c biogenesis protein CcsA, partial [Gammaproteobacteria bacterium]|nr:cytochrome c biogenesis protein CcsA [Gammaproteobacteria bacterium]
MIIFISIVAIIFYLLATVRLGSSLFYTDDGTKRPHKSQFLVLGFIALLLHSLVLYQNINIIGGLNLGFYNALSLMSWGVSLMVLLAALTKPLENLAIVIFPLTALALLLEIIFQSSRILPDTAPMGLRLHVLLSICAYSLLTIAALQAALLALQDRQISTKRPANIMQLPPMQIMEDLLIQIIAIGFFMLSLSLATGLMFLHDIFAQHLAHKAVFSILAWIIFGILLWGRWTQGWRGKKA